MAVGSGSPFPASQEHLHFHCFSFVLFWVEVGISCSHKIAVIKYHKTAGTSIMNICLSLVCMVQLS